MVIFGLSSPLFLVCVAAGVVVGGIVVYWLKKRASYLSFFLLVSIFTFIALSVAYAVLLIINLAAIALILIAAGIAVVSIVSIFLRLRRKGSYQPPVRPV